MVTLVWGVASVLVGLVVGAWLARRSEAVGPGDPAGLRVRGEPALDAAVLQAAGLSLAMAATER
jgi:hypothetical protein